MKESDSILSKRDLVITGVALATGFSLYRTQKQQIEIDHQKQINKEQERANKLVAREVTDLFLQQCDLRNRYGNIYEAKRDMTLQKCFDEMQEARDKVIPREAKEIE